LFNENLAGFGYLVEHP